MRNLNFTMKYNLFPFFFLLLLFSVHFLSFDFLKFVYDMPRCSFLFSGSFICLLLVLSSLPFCELYETLVWCQTSVWGNFQSSFLQILLLIFSFWYFHYVYVTSSITVLQFLGTLLFLFVCFLCFSVLEVSIWHILKLKNSFTS